MSDVLEPQSLAQLLRLHAEDPALVSAKKTQFYGWVRRTRVGGGGTIVFLDVYDGTAVGNLNCLASEQDYALISEDESESFRALTFAQLSQIEHLSMGCAVVVEGTLVLSPPTATQAFELNVRTVRLIGAVEDPINYPLQKGTEKKMTALRQLPFLRFRAQVMQCIFRVRSKLNLAVHQFMDMEDVIQTDPNIMTISDCEGAGETFTVSPSMFSKHAVTGEDIPVGLTVSSQLPLEATILGFKQVYTCQKSFRAEKSDTNKHLAEFLHVEYEAAFITLEDLLQQAERFVKYVIRYGFERCAADFDWLESKFRPTDVTPTRALLMEALDKPFVRIKHREAVDLIQQLLKDKTELPGDDGKLKRVKVKKFPSHDEDLGSEHEKLLVTYFGYQAIPEEQRAEWLAQGKEVGAFVFVSHWPLKIKSFYMKQCDDGSGECESFDLLCPRVGELFGGSMREYRYEKLQSEIERRAMDVSPIQWYLDLRKSGSQPHGGWGMGFDRLVMLVCGVQSVRDVVPFPVYYTHCPY
ncbi:hypothetical protein FisN_14Hh082 [Fistulifera solaris]|uniref:asparagine--tRNA ligase n=1 Tax=Fistulifera solaris TaxID=1519565 RepID=A0A1Z5K8A3_FISSO|nr:hypothetical protein FisN_14Hh082 [Fistulifera solaris]|eukprot:GAX22467.1 hypothetical protein FisN_14Hh082 [Fistulifera solaris]